MSSWPIYLVDLQTFLMLIRLLVLILVLRKLKPIFLTPFNSTEPNKLNNFLFQCCLYFCTNPAQFNIDIAKINFIITYLTKVVQNWFEISLN